MAITFMAEQGRDLSDRVVAAISPRDPPSRAGCGRPPARQMLLAFEQFNNGEYWQQHETLEAVWRAEEDASMRNFYKGIIQIGVGFFHLTRGNYAGVMKVLPRGIVYLRAYAPECRGVNVARLVQEASAVYYRAREAGPDRLGEIPIASLPRIEYRRE